MNLILSAILIGVIFQARLLEMFSTREMVGRKKALGGNMSLVVVCKRSFQYNFYVFFAKGMFFLKFLKIVNVSRLSSKSPLRGNSL